MVINFPSNPVNGNTYIYLGIQYTYIKEPPAIEGYWAVKTPATVGIATPTDINEGTDSVKYITPLGLNGSRYVSEDESTGETVLDNSGLERLKTTAQGVEVTGSLKVNGTSVVKQESGTFIPRFKFGGSTTGISYTDREGWWTKTGNQVTVYLHINLSSKGTSRGSATIEGLPFAPSSSRFRATGSCVTNNLSNTGWVVGEMNRFSNTIRLFSSNDNTRSLLLTNANFSEDTSISLSMTYPV